MTELSVTKTEKASKARNPQTLPENWLKDRIKSKYAGGNVGDLNFLCKVCQKTYSCESCYGDADWHQKAVDNKDKP
jgi:hypothetical protein